jgi:hypothetical protein
MRTRGTIYQQININAERKQFPQSQILTPDDDHSKHVVKTFKVTSFY